MGELRVLDTTGDTRILFDPNNSVEVKSAKKTFKDLTKKGFLAFRSNKKGEKGEQITSFDAQAAKIILTPPIVGG